MGDRDTWKRLADHAAEHHGVVGSAVAKRDLDVPDQQLQRFKRSGHLIHKAPRAFIVAGTPDTWRHGAMVATTSSNGWISHRAAAALWGLDGFIFRRIEVLVPYEKPRTKQGWRLHRTRSLGSVDLLEVDNIPCTAVPRTIIDLAAVGQPYELNKALDSACRKWPDMLDAICARFRELAGRGRSGTRLLRSMLAERTGESFTQTGFEEITRKLAASVGLPAPMPQCAVHDDDGYMYLDLGWPAIRWAVECDSLAWHSGKHAHEGDRARRRRLKALARRRTGRTVITW